jgi:hypothetical protein
MPKYLITASRETIYEFEVEGVDENDALEQVNQLQLHEDVERFAIDWYPLEITDCEEQE